MKLFIGAAMQAKLDIACNYLGLMPDGMLISDGADMSPEDFEKARIVNHFHLFVKKYGTLFDTADKRAQFLDMLLLKNPDVIIIGDEIGSGIVPIDEGDRLYRENYGRMMCVLSQNSEAVIRIICGICQEIKK
jgi:hypothetical protein